MGTGICPWCGKKVDKFIMFRGDVVGCRYCGIHTKQTNADRIRSMTDEELAGILAMQSIISPPWCSEKYDCPYADQDPVRCDLCALDWLKEEASE